jgi:hypothetical protein
MQDRGNGYRENDPRRGGEGARQTTLKSRQPKKIASCIVSCADRSPAELAWFVKRNSGNKSGGDGVLGLHWALQINGPKLLARFACQSSL